MWAMPVPTGDAATTVEILVPADAAFYVVAPGESLISICREILGDPSLVAEVAALNELSDPDKVAVGQRLRLPVISGAAPAATDRAEATTPDEPSEYTVRDGDSLMTIAQRVCGTVRAFDEIFEANRDQLETPDELRPGMVLRIPTSDERPS